VVEAASGADSVKFVSQAAYARSRGCTPQYVSNLIRVGKIRTYGEKKHINPIEANATLDALRDDSREGVRQSNAERYGKTYTPPPMAAPQSRSKIALSPDQQAALGGLGKDDPNEIPEFAKSKQEREFIAVQRERIELAREVNAVVERDLAVQIAADTGRKWLDELSKVQMQLPTEVRDLVAKSFSSINPDQLALFEHEARQMIAKAHREAVGAVTAVLEGMAKNLEAPPN
jgi:hypothetical protein